MGAGADILARLDQIEKSQDRIEAKLDRLLSVRASTGGGASAPSGGDALPDHMLEQSWADKDIRKDPPRYSGPPMVGRRYSEATSEWHDANASFMAWKAEKGKAEVPVRMKNNGKPWWEADEFEAKLCRAWSNRNRGRALPASAPAQDFGGAGTDFGSPPPGDGFGSDLPF